MATSTKDVLALREWDAAHFPEALRLIEEGLDEKESADRWNSWAATQFCSGQVRAAELGFRRALELEPQHGQAAANLGCIVASRKEVQTAIHLFDIAVRSSKIDPAQRALASQKLNECRAELARTEVPRIRWFHSISLGNGVVTPGAYDTSLVLDRIAMPANLSKLSVLDIGAWDGYFSFEAERRGAARVLAMDGYVWLNKTWDSKAGFELARTVLGSKVEDLNFDVMDVAPENVGTFDVVLFLGVLYHLRHPLLALERIRSITTKLLIVETAVDLPHIQRPAAAFYPGSEANADETNWWAPNESCCIAMLKSAGFRNIKTVGRALPDPLPPQEQLSYGRMAFHAEV
ncbi:MAG TPA: DUF1698 domain-containing protein [Candidatus Acidoferrum sp.]|jgi:tRNA (mo5U34)-methyltransferase